MKKLNKKGFTIVELEIVIAVIAILAAVMIPTFSGIIKKANQSALQQEAAALYKEAYALDLADGTLDGYEGDAKVAANEIKTVEGKTVEYKASVDKDNNPVVKFVYSNDKYTATFENGAWTVTDKAA